MKFRTFLTIVLFIIAAAAACPASAQEQQVTPPAAPAPTITVDEAILCTGVVDRVPQGVPQAAAPAQAQPAAPAEGQAAAQPAAPAVAQPAAPASTPQFSAGTVCCYCKVSGTAPTTIKHVWYFGQNAVRTIELTVEGSPWRTWSNKTVSADMAGKWKVEIQDAAGTVLKTLEFEVK